MADLPLGQIIDDQQKRDAIHIAVAPVIATERLRPGQHIGFVGKDNERVGGVGDKNIGIVDPFLKDFVLPEQRFWMFLYPQTITSLRHDWTHPAFSKEDARKQSVDKSASELWLRKFCASSDCPDYDTVMKAIQGQFETFGEPNYYGGSINNEYLYFGGLDAHGDIPDEFWEHAEIVLGVKLQVKPKYFSCSC